MHLDLQNLCLAKKAKKQHPASPLPEFSLTLSCPMWRLCGVLTLVIYIYPNNGPIDLLLDKKMVLHVMAIISSHGSKSIGPLLMKLQYL
jgi:hypothetical protein